MSSVVYCAGEVMCTIHSKVVEDYQKELHPGAVLVLRQVKKMQSVYCNVQGGGASGGSLYTKQ